MADIAAINTVYNHFLTTYAPKGTNTKYDTHKKSELRGVYNSMVKLNKDAPLFLLDSRPSTTEFAVGLKENARTLKNTISSLSIDDSDSLLNQKSISSSDNSVVSATYIGNADTAPEDIPTLDISVEHLATKQINQGNFMDPNSMGLEPGTYSFDIHSRDMDYEFQFNIGENDNNRVIEEKLARLISKSNIGVSASVVENESGQIALNIESDETGIRGDKTSLFDISDDKTSKMAGTVEYFGIGNITQPATNSLFTLNGEERSTFSNHFSVEKTFELTLNGISKDGSSVSIGPKTDVESITENVSNLIEGYNSFINKINAYVDSQPYSKKLIGEMNKIGEYYGTSLESLGLSFGEDGTISLDKNLLSQTAQDEDALDQFSTIKRFTSSVLNKINKISLDPMEYTQKTIVAYKNPGRSFVSPYVTSNYSGMMFSGYC